MAEPRLTVLYDGVCRLCNGSVTFIIRRDPATRIRFAAMQSKVGQALLARHGLPPSDYQSFVVLDADRVLLRSDAALRIAGELVAPWPLLGRLGRVVPRRLRDGLYDLVARHRYRWFGRYDACLVPSPDIMARFLDG